MLLALAVSGCGATSESPAGGSASVNQCAFQPLPATDATFGRRLNADLLELQIDSTGTNGYSIDFCVAKPHVAGIRGISADVNLVSTSAFNADVNILLSPYQLVDGTFMYTELFVAENGDLRWGVETCSIDDVCNILVGSANRQSGTLSLGTVYNLSIAWNGSDTFNYQISGGATDSWTYTIPPGNPIGNDQLTTSEVAIGLFTSSTGGSVSTVGQFDNVQLSTDGTTFAPFDDFTGTVDPYTGGSKWTLIEGVD